ncbi:MAG: hypothetical protein HOL80_02215 [Candidatus Magasanikbacteria bacterium]|jgi:hypothetical protein|nr:hypothetical protein [Candidatus Magasanikbacteria bacterium]MBT5262692.1 hypothetical protein [Candidatus Magasanikbacteria bacterium]MBT5820306.1 hypothetical protein [Candidatus Magasanikbacteria bacterium]MBT6294808.1 hypothetical protein [Candidatus Magasanikbacteria bacterium]
MIKRSLVLRKLLLGHQNPHTHIAVAETEDKKYRYSVIQKSTRSKEENGLLEDDRDRLFSCFKNLQNDYKKQTDEVFAKEYADFVSARNDFLIRYSPTFAHNKNPRKFSVDFVPILELHGLNEFLDSFPLQFIPTKCEIARILGLAKRMHEIRLCRGEKHKKDPIEIVDIGGGNGALGKLITNLAAENNIVINYTTVDPDKTTIQSALDYYKNDKSLNFFIGNAEDFVLEMYKEVPSVYTLLKERKKLILEGEERISDLQIVLQTILQNENHQDTCSVPLLFLDVLEKDFGITYFNLVIDLKSEIISSIEEKYINNWRAKINELTQKIGKVIAEQPARFDLVINSWMPPGIDFTKDIREAGGVAILYALERNGISGCRIDLSYNDTIKTLGYEESYVPGPYYEQLYGWLSHSTPQARAMDQLGQEYFYKDVGKWAKSFSNAFVVQIHKDYTRGGHFLNQKGTDLVSREIYPWEEDLMRRGGPEKPVFTEFTV